MAYIIAMSNEKGGVAKTTSTLSLGAALAELNYRVLLIDLDPQANLSLALGLEAEEANITSASILIEGAALHANIPLSHCLITHLINTLSLKNHIPRDG